MTSCGCQLVNLGTERRRRRPVDQDIQCVEIEACAVEGAERRVVYDFRKIHNKSEILRLMLLFELIN